MQLFTGKDYLKIDIANNFGHDKLDWNERIEWFDKNEHQLGDIYRKAESPAMAFASLAAWNQTKNGQPTGYMISLDACASGLQFYSILAGCRKSAALCGIVNTGHRADAYTMVFQHMLTALGESSGITRSMVKQAVMTALYGSDAVPKRVFGKGSRMLMQFYASMSELAPGAWATNEMFKQLADPTALEYSWELPDGFTVRQEVLAQHKQLVHFQNTPYEVTSWVNGPKEGDKSLGPNATHSLDGMVVREMRRRCSYRPGTVYGVLENLKSRSTSERSMADQKVMRIWAHYLRTGFLSARILSFLNKDNMGHVDPEAIHHMISCMPKKSFQIVPTHDCFRAGANYGNDLRVTYNRIMAEIADSRLLEDLMQQIAKDTSIRVNKIENFAAEILTAEYALS